MNKFRFYIKFFSHASVGVLACGAAVLALLLAGIDASAARRSGGKKRARTAWTKKSGKSRYSHAQRSRRAKSLSEQLPFSLGSRIYLAGNTADDRYIVWELLGSEAKSTLIIDGGSFGRIDGSFMPSGEVFSLANSAAGKSTILWKGRAITDLTSDSTVNVAHACWMWDDEFYAAGHAGSLPTLWINAKALTLDDYAGDALDVCYDNKQYYCSGYVTLDDGTRQGRIWSSGGKVPLPSSSLSSVNGILVAGADVWLTGIERTAAGDSAVAYHNAERLSLQAQGTVRPTSITVAGDDIFVAGTIAEQGNERTVLWINGKPFDISQLKLTDVKLMREN